MNKNKAFINQWKRIEQQASLITPKVYASVALALHRKYGWGYQRINDLFVVSQHIWNECVDTGADMIEMCEEETGITVANTVTGKEM